MSTDRLSAHVRVGVSPSIPFSTSLTDPSGSRTSPVTLSFMEERGVVSRAVRGRTSTVERRTRFRRNRGTQFLFPFSNLIIVDGDFLGRSAEGLRVRGRRSSVSCPKQTPLTRGEGLVECRRTVHREKNDHSLPFGARLECPFVNQSRLFLGSGRDEGPHLYTTNLHFVGRTSVLLLLLFLEQFWLSPSQKPPRTSGILRVRKTNVLFYG